MNVTSRNPIQHLTELTSVLLDVSACPGDLKAAVDELFDWFAGVIDLDRDTRSNDFVDTPLSTGTLRPPSDAFGLRYRA